MKKIKASRMTDGKAWVRAGALQDQLVAILLVAVSHVETKHELPSSYSPQIVILRMVILIAPTFQRQL